tara:strand:- start:132 stop:401 length:270 start_codon:yes stop_codon:yes gene_type:complete
VLDVDDPFPLISVNGFSDTDLDGRPDQCDSICLDAGMIADTDDDGDGYSDLDEVNSNSDLLDANSIPSKGLPIWLIKAAKNKMEQDATN